MSDEREARYRAFVEWYDRTCAEGERIIAALRNPVSADRDHVRTLLALYLGHRPGCGDGAAFPWDCNCSLPQARFEIEAAVLGLETAMLNYFAARKSDVPVITTGHKAIEEATELVEAIATGEAAAIRHEIADLALVAAVVARQWGTTVEACIAEKAEHDKGRGEPKQDARLDVLRLHLGSRHALDNWRTHADPWGEHEHEHDGPGTIRGHKRSDLSYELEAAPIPLCGDCDGVGWVEGGEELQTVCSRCHGKGVEAHE